MSMLLQFSLRRGQHDTPTLSLPPRIVDRMTVHASEVVATQGMRRCMGMKPKLMNVEGTQIWWGEERTRVWAAVGIENMRMPPHLWSPTTYIVSCHRSCQKQKMFDEILLCKDPLLFVTLMILYFSTPSTGQIGPRLYSPNTSEGPSMGRVCRSWWHPVINSNTMQRPALDNEMHWDD